MKTAAYMPPETTVMPMADPQMLSDSHYYYPDPPSGGGGTIGAKKRRKDDETDEEDNDEEEVWGLRHYRLYPNRNHTFTPL